MSPPAYWFYGGIAYASRTEDAHVPLGTPKRPPGQATSLSVCYAPPADSSPSGGYRRPVHGNAVEVLQADRSVRK